MMVNRYLNRIRKTSSQRNARNDVVLPCSPAASRITVVLLVRLSDVSGKPRRALATTISLLGFSRKPRLISNFLKWSASCQVLW